jgi:hypothetical protein
MIGLGVSAFGDNRGESCFLYGFTTGEAVADFLEA